MAVTAGASGMAAAADAAAAWAAGVLGVALGCPFDGNDGAYAADITKTGNISIDFVLQAIASGTINIDFLLAPQLEISIDKDNTATTTATVTPSTSGAKTFAYQDFTVRSNSAKGYGIYVFGASTDLMGTGDHKIETLDDDKSWTDLTLNRWGYSLALNNNGNVSPEALTYSPLKAEGDTTKKEQTATPDTSGGYNGANNNDNWRLVYGANVGYATAADTYTNEVSIKVVANGEDTVALGNTNAREAVDAYYDQIEADKALEAAQREDAFEEE